MKGPMSYIVTIDTRGRVTIPVQLRRELGWMKRMKVILREVDGAITIEPIRNVKRPSGNRRR